jgi:TRAP-type C4-dicarboxylate transport system permease small subunit
MKPSRTRSPARSPRKSRKAAGPVAPRRSLAWWAGNSLEILVGGMLVAICVIVLMGVVFRYFLHIGLGWTDEAARYLQVWMTFVGATVAVKRWSHFQLAIVHQWIPHGAHRYFRIVAILALMVLAGVMIRFGIDITRVSWNQVSPMMGWNIGYLYLVVPLSGALMVLFALRHLVSALRGEPPREGVADYESPALPAEVE